VKALEAKLPSCGDLNKGSRDPEHGMAIKLMTLKMLMLDMRDM
jgi:hypothetical protein